MIESEYDEYICTVNDIINMLSLGDNMTLMQEKKIQATILSLANSTYRKNAKDISESDKKNDIIKDKIDLTKDQLSFIKHVLPILIQNFKLNKVSSTTISKLMTAMDLNFMEDGFIVNHPETQPFGGYGW